MQTQNLITYALLAFMAWYILRMIVGKVAPQRARELVQAGATLLDVRSPAEFGAGHLNGARNVPVQELSSRIAELGAKDRPIVVYCASGMRSASAKSTLKRAGFQAVHDLGAMARWQN
jgi:rhodanese-related sulfurtransferase